MSQPRRVPYEESRCIAGESRDELQGLAALGYAAFATQLCAQTPLGFDALPARVQAGWVDAARAIRQRVLEDLPHG